MSAALLAACTATDVASTYSGGTPGPGDPLAGGSSGSGGGGGTTPVGATPGGAQDIGLARATIAAGGVPSPASLTVEGLLSEHDLPTEGPPCTSLICARPATAFATSIETGAKERWVQIGMASGLTNFQRPPLDTVVVLDKSGSMDIDIAQTTDAITHLIDKLRDDDRLAILAFDDAVQVVQPLSAPGDRNALKAKVKAIAAGGGANMTRGLSDAFALAKASFKDPHRLHRVMLLSCGYADSNVQGPGSFAGIIEDGANAHIGFSFYGILLGFDAGIANRLSQARGGSYSFINDLPKVVQLFDTDFDTMVTPLAYDLKFEVLLPDPLEVQRVYGIPGDANGAPKTSFDVKTAFLSNRRGAIVVRVKEKAGQQAGATTGNVRLQLEPERAVMDVPASDTTTPIAGITDGEESFSGVGVRKTVFLVNELEGMKKACASWHANNKSDARAQMATLITLLEAQAAVISDAALEPEIALVEKLAANMAD